MRLLKKYIFIIFAILILLILWYHMPSNVNRTVNLCSLDGKCITVKFDVNWYKYILKPTQLQGKFSIDNRIYQTGSQGLSGFIKNIKLKFNNKKYIPAFLRELDNSKYAADDLALLFVCDVNLGKICLDVKDKDNNYITYYGPAKAAEEAKLLSGTLFNEIINY